MVAAEVRGTHGCISRHNGLQWPLSDVPVHRHQPHYRRNYGSRNLRTSWYRFVGAC